MRLHFLPLLILVLSVSPLSAVNADLTALGSLNQRRTTLSTPTPPSILFQATLGGSSRAFADGVAIDPSGDIYVAGYVWRPCCDSLDSLLLKFNSTGNLLWQRKWLVNTSYYSFFSNDRVATDASGNVYVAGYTSGNATGKIDASLLKFDSNGILLWQRRWGGNFDERASGLSVSPSGDVYVVGQGGLGGFIVQFSSNGSLVWQSLYGQSSGVNLDGVSVLPSGEFYVSGTDGLNATLLKFDSKGSLEWQKAWGVYGRYRFDDLWVASDSTGDPYVTGWLESFTYDLSGQIVVNSTVPIMKFDSTGNLFWQRLWPGGRQNLCCTTRGRGLFIDAAGNIFLIGQTAPEINYGANGMLLLKLSSNGDLVWEVGVGGGHGDAGSSIIMDSAGNLIAVGSVDEGPPYGITPLNYQSAPSQFAIETSTGQLIISNMTALPSNITISVSNVSTAFTGPSDAYIVKLTPPQQSRPSPPLALIAEAGENNISLSWAPPEFNGGAPVTGYHIYRGGSSGGETPLANTSNVLSYVDANVQSRIAYYYYVKAVNGLGESDASNEGHATAGATLGLTGFVSTDSAILLGVLVVVALFVSMTYLRKRRRFTTSTRF